ncbi:MAG: type IX secretion system sortase PorU [Muribaculaceae bacterium]|nr:type IX secretion system sortase PorU [Muribaculaceae bacterium]
MNRLYSYIITATFLAILLTPGSAAAFDTDVYAQNSVLSSGSWIKVRVPDDGMYRISASTLRSWGFSDPSKVVVRGYGGRRLSDKLLQNDYIDDLPLAASVADASGIVFYAMGAGEWTSSYYGYNYYRQNDFSNYGHYFIGLRDDDEPALEIPETGAPGAGIAPATTFKHYVQYEKELVTCPGEAGPVLIGEDFRYTRSRTFSIPVPDAESGNVYMQTAFMSDLSGADAKVTFTVNDELLPSLNADNIRPTSTSEYIHGVETVARRTFAFSADAGNTCRIKIDFSSTGAVNGMWLNYIALNYTRLLRLPDEGTLLFRSGAMDLQLANVKNGVTVWDISDPRNIAKVNIEVSGDKASWTMPTGRERTYIAWNSDARLPEPQSEGAVAAQNLHAHTDFDMVIVSPQEYASAAERLAQLHRDSQDTLKVTIVTPEQIYNEFSSGTLDVGALRRYFKMLYDRGLESGRPLRYVALMGRTTLDNRGITSIAPAYPTIPSWMPVNEEASLNDNLGYCTDDYTAMLEDGSGKAPGTDKLSIAIGRIPVDSSKDADDIVDKITEYVNSSKKNAWKQKFMFLADDQDGGIHLSQTEKQVSNFCAGDAPYLLKKVYMDAYTLEGSTYPAAREVMFRYLNEGVVWWNFIGHANISEWTHEHQLSYSDLTNMYLRHRPFIYAATCNFLRIDGTTVSGGELMFKQRNGGAIGIISAVRPVYISDNGLLNSAMGRAMAARDEKGHMLTPGEMYRRAKNDIRSEKDVPVSDTNRLRFVFIGDPALRLAFPSEKIVLDSIGGHEFDPEDQPVLAALQRTTLGGYICDDNGNVDTSFDGILLADIYDAERSVTTLGNGTNGVKSTFEDMGERIFSGSATVEKGRFTLNVNMPLELAQNFRPATVGLYAYATNSNREAGGVDRNLYAYGYDETVPDDTTPPVIESMVLNHSDFRNGDTVNPDPMLIATVRDDVGINLSNAGVGHQITAMLDDTRSITGLANYYTPASDGSPAGVINYPLQDLTAGNHSLRLRVWDTAGNAAEHTIDFFVAEGIAPKIYDIYSDANPASTRANFYLSHNRPDCNVTVTVTVYNLMGHPLWSNTVTGLSDMFISTPVTWDLCDYSGRRVQRGIYLYRATITTDGEHFDTGSRRIAVTAQ